MRILSTVVALALLAGSFGPPHAAACCPAPRFGRAVVNADQSVIIIWDAANKIQHFIRQASFKSDADDFGFLVPTPAQPSLEESGNDAFTFLERLTAPPVQFESRPAIGCTCAGAGAPAGAPKAVRVLDEKLVAGFNATVLEADSADALVNWLKDHEYAFSPEVEAWAKPYVDAGWKITALKVAKDAEGKNSQTVTASALRLSFQTDRPLFPYREPDSKASAETLRAKQRLLRIYFIADARYQGELTKETPWSGRAVWSDKLSAENRKKALELLRLPESTGPAEWWLTEFEDQWEYRKAPADVYFAQSDDQKQLHRSTEQASTVTPPDGSVLAFAIVLGVMSLSRVRARRNRQ